MSPVPSPAPPRRSITRIACSPAVLLCGFVTLLILTCPNARGGDGLGVVVLETGSSLSGSSDMLLLDVPASAARPARAQGRVSTRSREPVSTVRPATLEERGLVWQAAVDGDMFRYSRAAVPLLVKPLPVDASAVESAPIIPMTGPAVGVSTKSQSARR